MLKKAFNGLPAIRTWAAPLLCIQKLCKVEDFDGPSQGCDLADLILQKQLTKVCSSGFGAAWSGLLGQGGGLGFSWA